MAKYRKKPVVIEAVRWEGSTYSWNRIQEMGEIKTEPGEMGTHSFYILTLEGKMKAENGDWIIKGVNGEFYPCKPDIFEKTYEKVD
jgi:hypothetical protein